MKSKTICRIPTNYENKTNYKFWGEKQRTEKETQMASTYMNRCLVPSVIREMKTKQNIICAHHFSKHKLCLSSFIQFI